MYELEELTGHERREEKKHKKSEGVFTKGLLVILIVILLLIIAGGIFSAIYSRDLSIENLKERMEGMFAERLNTTQEGPNRWENTTINGQYCRCIPISPV